ncbi:plasmid mobilization protein [Spirochaeta africana]|uniref:CopG family transcriptional regulator n=1 Tax=Spirochaeta africana (strain ATCC 700263 / DSM 8902 / Z-7692) TaxID=889378 RepID=H9UGC4_SPIAZ|nr:hypothetical protein [Spirochaeta africana]AFG36567.1 hypothetical protein Spiaf_0464 [Spirochaeta africana DSM 8902]
MSKTITVRLDDTEYEIFKRAADGQKRTISNYVAYATLNYTVNETLVDDAEMTEIMEHANELQAGLADIAAGRYTIIDQV